MSTVQEVAEDSEVEDVLELGQDRVGERTVVREDLSQQVAGNHRDDRILLFSG